MVFKNLKNTYFKLYNELQYVINYYKNNYNDMYNIIYYKNYLFILIII